MPKSLTRALLALACCALFACRPAAEPATVRVMSWNIAAGGGDLERIAATIRAAAPDIVGLQEVDVRWSERSAFADQATLLARMLDMEVRFGPIYSIAGDSVVEAGAPALAREFGVAILTKHPVMESRNHVISRLSTQTTSPEPRPHPGFLEVVVNLRGRRIRVFDTHLDYRADPRVRTMQAGEMLEIVRTGAAPTILLGDLNASPDAAELQPLFSSFADAWSVASGSGLTYPSTAPQKRIDYILISPHFRALRADVLQSDASDHLPVLAELQLITR